MGSMIEWQSPPYITVGYKNVAREHLHGLWPYWSLSLKGVRGPWHYASSCIYTCKWSIGGGLHFYSPPLYWHKIIYLVVHLPFADTPRACSWWAAPSRETRRANNRRIPVYYSSNSFYYFYIRTITLCTCMFVTVETQKCECIDLVINKEILAGFRLWELPFPSLPPSCVLWSIWNYPLEWSLSGELWSCRSSLPER